TPQVAEAPLLFDYPLLPRGAPAGRLLLPGRRGYRPPGTPLLGLAPLDAVLPEALEPRVRLGAEREHQVAEVREEEAGQGLAQFVEESLLLLGDAMRVHGLVGGGRGARPPRGVVDAAGRERGREVGDARGRRVRPGRGGARRDGGLERRP